MGCSCQSGEGGIRRHIIEADLVDCMVAMPGQLFYSTQIPVCLWFLTRDESAKGYRKRTGETLFIDARKFGTMIDRVHRELTDSDIQRLADTYHAWQGKFVVPPLGGTASEKPPKGGTSNAKLELEILIRGALENQGS